MDSELYFDFIRPWRRLQRNLRSLREGPLARSLGLARTKTKTKAGPGQKQKQKQEPPWIIDATCGTGADSLLMLALGAKVTAFERHPLVACALADCRERALADKELEDILNTRFELFPYDICLHSFTKTPDIIYYDPMYRTSPSQRKSLPRKEMQIFERLVGADRDCLKVFRQIAKINPRRLVVKRPRKAQALVENPSASYPGRSTRYDMYTWPSSCLKEKLP